MSCSNAWTSPPAMARASVGIVQRGGGRAGAASGIRVSVPRSCPLDDARRGPVPAGATAPTLRPAGAASRPSSRVRRTTRTTRPRSDASRANRATRSGNRGSRARTPKAMVPTSTRSPKFAARASSASSPLVTFASWPDVHSLQRSASGRSDGLVAHEHRRVHDAVGERLLGQHAQARFARARDQSTVAQPVQVFADHAAVVERHALIGDERRDLAQRILRDDAGVAVDRGRVGGDELDPVAQPELGGRDQALAHERRSGGVEDLQAFPVTAACRREAAATPGPSRTSSRRACARRCR